jgi:hypothetical protein
MHRCTNAEAAIAYISTAVIYKHKIFVRLALVRRTIKLLCIYFTTEQIK